VYLYHDADTVIHRLHPVTKMAALLAGFVLALVFAHPAYLAALMLLAVVLAVWARALPALRRVGKPLLILFIVTAILWMFFRKGQTPLLELSPLRISRESALYGVAMGLRLDLMILCGVLFLSATRIEAFTAGLSMLGTPYSVCFAVTLGFRLVPLFMESAAAVLQAQRCRGLDLRRGNALERLRKVLPVLVPVFLGAVRRADDMAIALESKGFRSGARRTSHMAYPFGGWDVACLSGMAAMTIAAFWLRASGYGGL
jgi:energy-coupling factor transport system permease protein